LTAAPLVTAAASATCRLFLLLLLGLPALQAQQSMQAILAHYHQQLLHYCLHLQPSS
jgi:hypothetical protein